MPCIRMLRTAYTTNSAIPDLEVQDLIVLAEHLFEEFPPTEPVE